MTPDNRLNVGPGADDISDPGEGSPGFLLSPELRSLLEVTERQVLDTWEEISNVYDDVRREIESDIGLTERELGVAVSGGVGSLDSEIFQREQEVWRHVGRKIDELLTEIVYAENELTTVGVYIPGTTDEIANVIINDNPNDVLAMLMGQPPLREAECAVTTPDAESRIPHPPPGSAPIVCTPASPPGVSPPPPTPASPPPPPPSDDADDVVVGGYRECPEGFEPYGDWWHDSDGWHIRCRRLEPPSPPPPAPPEKDCGCGPKPPPICPPASCHVEHTVVCDPPPGEPPPPPPPAPPDDTGEPDLPPPSSPPTPDVPLPPPPAGPGLPPVSPDVPHPPEPDFNRPARISVLPWCRDDICKIAEDKLHQIEYVVGEAADAPPPVKDEERTIFGTLWAGITYPVRSIVTAGAWIASGFDGDVAEEANKEAGRFLGLEYIGAEALRTVLAGPFIKDLEHMPSVMRLGSQIAAARIAEDKTGFPATYLLQSSIYLYNYANPQYIPEQSGIDASYLCNEITFPQWECMTQSLGNLADCANNVVIAKSTRPGVSELVQLYNRGELTRDVFITRMRERGILKEDYTWEYQSLSKFLPPYTDLMSMMIRDTFDPKVVEQFEYDKDFDKKFNGQVKEWARGQGIEETIFKQIWRAHWKIPSNTQLYEIYHRFRRDRPERQEWEAEWLDPISGDPKPGAPPEPRWVSLNQIRNALEVNDNAPFWVDFLVGINAHPITRTDAIDAYHSGAFTEDELYNAMRDNMYSPENAQRLVDIQKVKRARRITNLTGAWSIRKILNEFRKGTIDRRKANDLLEPLIVDANQRADALDKCTDEVWSQVRAAGIKKARRAFFVGEWDARQTENELERLGVEGTRIAQLLAWWESDRTGRFREPTVRMLVDWMRIGAISDQECYRRAVNLGFNEVDASRIVATGQDASVRDQRRKFTYVRTEYEHAVKNLRQAARLETDYLEGRRAELLRSAKIAHEELVRIEKELADRVPGPRG